MGYYVKNLGVTCEDCINHEYCELIKQLNSPEEFLDFHQRNKKFALETKLKELNEQLNKTSLLNFMPEEKLKREKEREQIIKELQEFFNKLKKKIEVCLKRRAYVAVVKGYLCFCGQEYWEEKGIISDCRKCEYDLPQYGCTLEVEMKHRRGFCSRYKYNPSWNYDFTEEEEDNELQDL